MREKIRSQFNMWISYAQCLTRKRILFIRLTGAVRKLGDDCFQRCYLLDDKRKILLV